MGRGKSNKNKRNKKSIKNKGNDEDGDAETLTSSREFLNKQIAHNANNDNTNTNIPSDPSISDQVGHVTVPPAPVAAASSSSSSSESPSLQLPIQDSANSTNDMDDIDPHLYEIDEYLTTQQLLGRLAAAAAGNFLEWFDFAIFGLLAEEIGKNFFPDGNETARLLDIFSLYAGAFCMRPLGGMLFGYIGDKFGRLYALRLSIFMMAFPTFLTGCLPSYASIGTTATVFLVILRLFQGLSVGGEFTGALVYVLEICPPSQRVLFGFLVQLSGTGTLLASLIEAILRNLLNDEQMTSYGWRIPFLFGILVALFGLWMRRALPDSHLFQQMKEKHQLKSNPLKYVLFNYKLHLFLLIGHLCMFSSVYYTLYVWFPTYLESPILRKSENHVIENPYAINACGLLFCGIFGIISARISDRQSHSTKIMVIAGVICIISILIFFPIVEKLDKSQYIGILCIVCFLSATFGFYFGPVSTWAVDLLPNIETRYSGMGIGYNTAVTLFGGTAPLVATAMTSKYGLSGYSWILFLFSAFSILVNIGASYFHQTGSLDTNLENDHMNEVEINEVVANINSKSEQNTAELELPKNNLP